MYSKAILGKLQLKHVAHKKISSIICKLWFSWTGLVILDRLLVTHNEYPNYRNIQGRVSSLRRVELIIRQIERIMNANRSAGRPKHSAPVEEQYRRRQRTSAGSSSAARNKETVECQEPVLGVGRVCSRVLFNFWVGIQTWHYKS